MNKEKLIELYKKYEVANREYKDYVSQFFTSVWNGQVVKEATDTLTQEKLDKIVQLRDRADGFLHKWKEAMDDWDPRKN